MERRYDLRKIGIHHEDDDLDAHEATKLLIKEVEKWKRLDAEAATHVESVICMKSRHFTGEEPYVGWRGLGIALQQDYLDRDLYLKEIEYLKAKLAILTQQKELSDGICNS